MKKLLFFVTEDWYFCSHRLPLALAAKAAGYDVSVITHVCSHGDVISASGLGLIPLDLSRRGVNPFRELKVIARLISIYRSERPDIVHHVALKPVLYGALASRIANVPCVINAMAGLGLLFSSKTLKAKVARPFFISLFRFLLNRKGMKVILQNPDDRDFMHRNGILKQSDIALIRGSGVDISEYKAESRYEPGCEPGYESGPTTMPLVILASRLLWDKGVAEFVDAANRLKQQGVCARFALVGEGDAQNPRSIDQQQLEVWRQQGVVEIWGKRENMPDVFAQSDIVCLPSFYGEGVPKVLIEAAACEKPIVTTDTPGCREIVHNGVNGLYVPVRDSLAVATALKKLIESPDLRKAMGKKGRERVESEFSLDRVNRETLALYKQVQQP
ncbi:MAG TPA: glycosyltransferase family 1 protein [Gammaproteobacteria bacterium]|nr:glycosyltransferase family 1 protein [Gammaproteobacteria bacterium]